MSGYHRIEASTRNTLRRDLNRHANDQIPHTGRQSPAIETVIDQMLDMIGEDLALKLSMEARALLWQELHARGCIIEDDE